MVDVEVRQLGTFLVAGLLLNLTPGPDLLYTATCAARDGHRAGWVAALGISSGCLVHLALGALGVSALLAASATAFGLLELAGAAWLVWLGWRMLRMPAPPPHLLQAAASGGPRPLPIVFRDGALVNLLNPKIALFFLAFVPQFIAPDAASPVLAFTVLGALFVVNGTLVTGALGTLAASAGRRLRDTAGRPARAVHAARRWLPRLVGAAFVGMGLRVALEPT